VRDDLGETLRSIVVDAVALVVHPNIMLGKLEMGHGRADTAWDLGVRDQTAIWFAQVVGREVHVIDVFSRWIGITRSAIERDQKVVYWPEADVITDPDECPLFGGRADVYPSPRRSRLLTRLRHQRACLL
jgi:hypothetical protein